MREDLIPLSFHIIICCGSAPRPGRGPFLIKWTSTKVILATASIDFVWRSEFYNTDALLTRPNRVVIFVTPKQHIDTFVEMRIWPVVFNFKPFLDALSLRSDVTSSVNIISL